MAVTIDSEDCRTRKIEDKKTIGHRLALLARGFVGKEDIVHSGPVFDKMEQKGSAVHLHFTHLGGGLAPKKGKVTGFAVAGNDKVFHWADARVKGDVVVVTSKKVRKPVAVRYGWADQPDCNLRNKEGLPATPFRTDQWPGATYGLK